MRTSILIGAMLVVVNVLMPSARAADHTKDTTDVVKKAVADDKAVLLDVREKSEWDDGHLEDAKLLPLSVLRAGAKPEDRYDARLLEARLTAFLAAGLLAPLHDTANVKKAA